MADWAALLHQFHWLRPLWLLLIPLALLLTLWLLRHPQQSSHWQKIIDPALLPYLLQRGTDARQRWPILLLGMGLVLSALALAGPAWEKLPQPVHKRQDATVILLDLSPSMEAQDLQPSRLVRARLKLIDLLKQRREGVTALVAYAGEAHTVTPLTDDTATIINLLPALSPAVMPLRGSNTEMAVERGVQLLHDAGHSEGELLLVTDGVADDALQHVRKLLPAGVRLSILGVGTSEGAPVPLPNGGFAKNHLGNLVLAKLNSSELADLAASSGGRFTPLTADDRDLQLLTSQPSPLQGDTRQLQREFDTWLDRGPWLLLPLLPLLLLAFRRGWLLTLLLFPMLLFPGEPAQAGTWQDLWQTPDQQASALLQQGDAAAAADKFQRPDWKAAAQYRAGNYDAAAQLLEQDPSADGHYNRGNALAKAGNLQGALEAYDQALQLDPQLEDAAANRAQVEQLLQQQQQQQNADQNPSQDGNPQQQNQPGQDSQGQQQQGQNQQGQNPPGGSPQQSPENGQQQGQDSPGDQSPQSGKQAGQSPAEDDQSRSGEQQSTAGEQNGQDENPSGQSQREAQGAAGDDNREAGETADREQADAGAQGDDDQSETSGESDAGDSPAEGQLSEEARQTMEQMLRRIPDDPSGLLRNKFDYQYRQRRQAYQQGTWEPPENNATQRW